MKILIDARMYGLENSGIGRYLIKLIEGLNRLNTENYFTILLRKKYFDSLNFEKNWTKIIADFGHYTFEEQLRLPGILKEVNPDLVHFPHLNVPIFYSGKFVVTVHDLTMHKQKTDATTLPLPFYYLKRLPYLLASRFAVSKSEKIIVPSNAVKDEIIEYYKELSKKKVDVIYEGYDSLTVSDDIADVGILQKYNIKKPYFTYVGNAYPHKNLQSAIRAIVLLNKDIDNKTTLVLGGSRGVFTKKLEKIIREENGGEFVRLIGFVKDSDLPALYKESAGFVYPSLAEGFGLQGLEAMSAGTVVLASNIEVFKEIYDDVAIYFDPRDPRSISSAMGFVLNLEKGKRKLLIEKSQMFIKKYSWRKMAEETMEVYKKQ